MRRTLSDTLIDLSESFLGAANDYPEVRINAVSLDLPIRVSVAFEKGELVCLADVPRRHWQTAFDQPLGRLVLQYGKKEER